MNFIFEQLRVGGDRNLGYLIGDRAAKVAVVVDPSYDPEPLFQRAEAQGLKVTSVLNTHGHHDHIAGNDAFRSRTGAKIQAHPDSPARPDVPLEDGARIEVGCFRLSVLYVPGHCPDHILFHLPDQQIALTGDHLFVGKIGGTQSEADARTEYQSLQRVHDELPGSTTIWPGHDYGCRPSSTITLEWQTNPFLLADGVDAFLRLKQEWSGFKASHGLA